MLADGALALPLPGAGATAQRFDALAEIAARDLSLARICEGHTDAIAILAEAKRAPQPGLYGVWAAGKLEANNGRISGRTRYASGALGIDRALITAGDLLFDIEVARVRPIADTWRAVGMAATESVDVELAGVDGGDPVGPAGFYLSRRGFWYGAVGVAACWYGGALGAFRMLRGLLVQRGANDHQRAHLGAIAASCEAMRAVLHAAAADIDRGELGRRGALVARHVVEQGCQDVLLRTGRASGSSPLVFDRAHAQRAADLVVYLRQHHAERDLAELGELELS